MLSTGRHGYRRAGGVYRGTEEVPCSGAVSGRSTRQKKEPPGLAFANSGGRKGRYN
jgi:hypothetical protein